MSATFSVVNMDADGEGLNDLTIVAPVGGNSATTLGEARMNVLREAGRVWSRQLSSAVPIVIEARFDPLQCSPYTATLGTAGAKVGFANFRGAPVADVFYPAALADALSGSNINSENDVKATFSSALDGSSCLGGRTFYLGFDHNPGSNLDLLAVVLHELGHGLGFMSVLKPDGNSSLNSGRLSIYDTLLYSEAQQRFLPAMTVSERQAALVGGSSLVWNGAAINEKLSLLTSGLSSAGGHLRIYAPFSYNDGASTSHWDTSAQWSINGTQRQLLMEPYISANPRGHTDLTGCSLRDMGWSGTRCPDTTGTNLVPIAHAQTAFGSEDTPLRITLTGSDADGPSALSFAIVSSPADGKVTLAATGAGGSDIIYTPAADFDGTDVLSFQVSDGDEMSNVANVSISVAGINDAPVATGQSIRATRDSATTITLRGSDAEGSTLNYQVTSPPANGSLSGAGFALTYTPKAGFVGADSFAFHVDDGALQSASATVSISVEEPAAPEGGGGATTGLTLLLLLLTLIQRRQPVTGQRYVA